MRTYERKYLRIKHRQEIRIKTVADVYLLAFSENISVGGMDIICDQVSAQMIISLGQQFNPDKPAVFSVELYLGKTKSVVEASCSVQNVRRLAQDSFGFNLKFTKFKRQARQSLENFVKKQASISCA